MPGDGVLPEGIRSPSARDRRAAMRDLEQLTDDQLSELRALRASERDIWVRRRMDLRLSSARSSIPEARPETDLSGLVDQEIAEEIREQARTEISELVVHELRHAALRIELAAEEEVEDFQLSATKSALDGFRRIANSFSQLAASGRTPHMYEVSLAEVVQEAAAEFVSSLWPPELIGPEQLIATADAGLLQLAVVNSIRNGIEATEAAFHPASPVFVTWGKTDRDAWIAVHDDGVGLATEASELFEAHRTTKGGSSHAGLGLTIIRNAMRAMGGQVTLENRLPRGAICELRWPQEGAS
jgi:signal transduction histidine kinase